MDTDRATEAAPPLDSSLRLEVRNCVASRIHCIRDSELKRWIF